MSVFRTPSRRSAALARFLLAPVLALAALYLLLFLHKAVILAIAPALKPMTILGLAWVNYYVRAPLFLLFLLALLPWDGRFLRGSMAPRGLGTALRMVGRLRKAFLVFFLCLFLVLSPFGARQALRALTTAGGGVFQEKCSACHASSRALDFFKPRAGWQHTVERMRDRRPGWISDPERDQIVAYLFRVRSYDDGEVFTLKCRRCHPFVRFFERQRTPEQWDRVVDRIWRENFLWMQLAEADQIKRYIRGRLEDSPGVAASAAAAAGAAARTDREHREVFEIKCGRCHYLDICLEPDLRRDQWPAILRRMSEKCPDYLTPEEAVGMHDWLLREIADPKEFAHNYPHARGPKSGNENRRGDLRGLVP